MGNFSPELLAILAVGLIFTGAIAGVLAGLLGVGGGIVIVPVLILMFDFLNVSDGIGMHLAVATSLATIIPTSFSSMRSHRSKGNVDMDLIKLWAPVIFIGAAIGGVLSKFLDSSYLTMIFGFIALAVAINMVLPKKVILGESLPQGLIGRRFTPVGIGLFSSLMGIGGGTLSVPILTAFSFPVHRAVGTASAFGLVIAIPAVLGFIWSGIGIEGRPPFTLGYVNIPAAVLIFSISVFTAPMGSGLAQRLDSQKLRLAFAIFLFLSSIRMLWTVFN